MTMKPSISFLTAESGARLVTKVNNIIAAMTGNTNYPTPTPALPLVTAAADAFRTALAEASDGGKEKTAVKNARRAELTSLLRQLSAYVVLTCGEDMTKLLSSGFPIQKPTRTRVGALPAPETPFVSFGARSGELDAVTSPVFGAATYNWRISLAATPAVFIQTAQTTAARHTFASLTPGQVYALEVNAVGSAGPSDWSNAAQSMAV